jgi:hypothetical protein
MAVVMKTRMMLTSVAQGRVNTGVALARVSKSTVARRAAAARPSVIPEATREAMAKNSATARSRVTAVVRKNQATAVKNHPGTDVRNTAVKPGATAVSSRSMVLTLIALADTVVKRNLDMAVARRSRATAVKSTVATNLLVMVLTLTALVDMVVQRVWNTVVSDLIRLMVPLVFLVVSVKRLRTMVAAAMMKMNMVRGDKNTVLVAMVAQADMVRRGMEGGTRHDVFSAGSKCDA